MTIRCFALQKAKEERKEYLSAVKTKYDVHTGNGPRSGSMGPPHVSSMGRNVRRDACRRRRRSPSGNELSSTCIFTSAH